MSGEFRTALYFFVQFFSGGAFHAYGGIWFASLGFTANQIGALTSFPIFVVLLINIFVGRLADRAKDWRQVLVIGGTISFLASCGLLLDTSYAAVFAFWSLALIAQTLMVPVADGAALFLTRQGRGHIGTLRAFSTAGYVLSLLVTGLVIAGFGGGVFAALFVALSGARLLGAVTMPEFKTADEQAQPVPKLDLRGQLRMPWLTLPLLGWAIVYATIQVLNSFLALVLKQQGHSEWTISMLFASGAVAEALVFFLFRHFSDRFDLRWLIVLACASSVLRWVAMAYEPPLAVLYAVQCTHGIGYALGFAACITHMAKHTPEGNAAEAQSLFMVMQMVSAIAVITLFGGLMEAYGAKAFWGSAVVALIGTGIALAGLRYRPSELG